MKNQGYTLIELMVAVGLFAFIMTLASGAYLMMIGINRQTQSITAGVDDLSFALESMTRNIRTGTGYACNGSGDCSPGSSFSFTNSSGDKITYSRDISTSVIQETVNGGALIPLTDSSAVQVTTLTFYVSGTGKFSDGNYEQPHVTIIISGSIDEGHRKTEPFTVETGATMRGADL